MIRPMIRQSERACLAFLKPREKSIMRNLGRSDADIRFFDDLSLNNHFSFNEVFLVQP